ncbi:hypothetical protein PSHT_08924 [Puccinia striiformis]|uniref:Alkaline phytoceramidase n=1 Tax=Puccinia striiformis TaxID=27350 RepID=A0A2S4VKA3_9BASI|nr:hypothetical protein PSHT_08924 [Puccinia striiformis]
MGLSPELHVTRWWSNQPPVEGFWGPAEANYAITRFIAEFTNTISNLIFGDELPMIFAGAMSAYVTFDTGSPNLPRSRFVRCLPSLLIIYSFGVTAIYLWYPNPVFHQTAFAAISLITTSRSVYISLSAPERTYREKKNKSDGIRYSLGGTIMFIIGFLIWNIDNFLIKVVLSLGIAIDFSAQRISGYALKGMFWHLATGTGTYLNAVGTQLMSLSLKEGSEGFEIKRGGIFGLCPYTSWNLRPSSMSLVGGRTNRPSKASGVPRSQLCDQQIYRGIYKYSIKLYFCGIKKCRDQDLPLPLVLGQVGIALIGIGSFWFHATLRYEWQLGDELPMIFSGALGVYIAFDTCSSNQQRTRFVRCLPYLLSMYAFGVTAVYLWYPNPVFHQIAFAAISLINTSRSAYLALSAPGGTYQEQKNRTDGIRYTFGGTIIFLAGFLIWNIDNVYCDQISQLKEYLGAPWSFILEGHAWWHLATGTGAYLGSVGGQLITLSLKEGAEGFEIRRGGIFGLCPYVARTSSRIPSKLQ